MSGASSGTVAATGAENSASSARVPILRTEKLRRVFRSGTEELTVLQAIDLAVAAGELLALVGPSGAGKSTLLHLLAALDRPTSGTVYFDGNPLDTFTDRELAFFRNRSVGFVWQRHHLLADFTAVENVAMPLLVAGVAPHQARETARELLAEVGLTGRETHRPGELSGGEQQRAAIARALVGRPVVLLADEPTGDLDEQNAESVFSLLRRLHEVHRLTSILATHNSALARRADRILKLEHGVLAPSGGEKQESHV